jgi:hypothetical protein
LAPICPHSSQFPRVSYQAQSSPKESVQLGTSEQSLVGGVGEGGEGDGGVGGGSVGGVGALPQKLGLGLLWLLQIVDLIQTDWFEILEYTPGEPAWAQPKPQLTTPARTLLSTSYSGPPLSPWQLSWFRSTKSSCEFCRFVLIQYIYSHTHLPAAHIILLVIPPL